MGTRVADMFSPNDPSRALQFFSDKMRFTTGPTELGDQIKSGGSSITIIDVRAANDYKKGHVPGAINLPEGKWQTLRGLDKSKMNVVYCYSTVCHLAARAAVEFAREGFPVMELVGGFNSWRKHDLPVDTGKPEKQAKSEKEAHRIQH